MVDFRVWVLTVDFLQQKSEEGERHWRGITWENTGIWQWGWTDGNLQQNRWKVMENRVRTLGEILQRDDIKSKAPTQKQRIQ